MRISFLFSKLIHASHRVDVDVSKGVVSQNEPQISIATDAAQDEPADVFAQERWRVEIGFCQIPNTACQK